ncbi:MAG: hypothetical protein JSW68_01795, partial [Burkholderiales bacterium]
MARESWRAALRSGVIERPVLALLRMRDLPGTAGSPGAMPSGRRRGARPEFVRRLTDRALKRVVRK